MNKVFQAIASVFLTVATFGIFPIVGALFLRVQHNKEFTEQEQRINAIAQQKLKKPETPPPPKVFEQNVTKTIQPIVEKDVARRRRAAEQDPLPTMLAQKTVEEKQSRPKTPKIKNIEIEKKPEPAVEKSARRGAQENITERTPFERLKEQIAQELTEDEKKWHAIEAKVRNLYPDERDQKNILYMFTHGDYTTDSTDIDESSDEEPLQPLNPEDDDFADICDNALAEYTALREDFAEFLENNPQILKDTAGSIKTFLKENVLTPELAELNPPLALGNAPDNGDCFYDSVAQLLTERLAVEVSSQDIRTMISSYAKDPGNTWVRTGFPTAHDFAEFQKYIEDMSEEGRSHHWGGDIDMKILATLLGITFEIHAAEGESLRFDTLPGGIEEGKTYINRDSETSQMQICPILYFSDAVTARPGNQSPPSEKLRETIIPEKIRRSLDKLSADQKTIPIAYFDHHFVPIFQKK